MAKVYENIFSEELTKQIRDRFYFVDKDDFTDKRVYFENSGGSLRLKSVVEASSYVMRFPESSTRPNKAAKFLLETINGGKDDFKKFINASKGSIVTNFTASRVLFNITEAILCNAPGSNVVTTCLDHPGSYDSAKYYCNKYNKEFRECKANPVTGGIDVSEVLDKVDKDTCLLSMIYTSNITGAAMDVEAIISEVRKVNPSVYILLDAVQRAPHGVIDFDKLQLDGVVVAPYKFFGNRGIGLGFVSERVASFPHEKITGKSPDVWELGSADASDFASFSKIIEYLCFLGSHFTDSKDKRTLIATAMHKIEFQEKFLLYSLLEGTPNAKGLRYIDGVTVHFDTEDLASKDLIIAISFDSIDCSSAVRLYDRENYIVFERLASSPYSKRMMDAFGLEGIIRVSPMHFNDLEEIEGFLIASEKIAKNKYV